MTAEELTTEELMDIVHKRNDEYNVLGGYPTEWLIKELHDRDAWYKALMDAPTDELKAAIEDRDDYYEILMAAPMGDLEAVVEDRNVYLAGHLTTEQLIEELEARGDYHPVVQYELPPDLRHLFEIKAPWAIERLLEWVHEVKP